MDVSVIGEVCDEVAYVYDGTLEGLLCAVFQAYASHEDPADVVRDAGFVQLRLAQRLVNVGTDAAVAVRVRRGIERACGVRTFRQVAKASLSSAPHAGTDVYRFVRYAMDGGRGPRAAAAIAHESVRPLFELVRGVENECEKMRQFARFEHLKGADAEVWFAKVNPRDSVVPLVLGHFVERFNVQPFIIYDENHSLAGVWDGRRRRLVDTRGMDVEAGMPGVTADEVRIQDAWRRFYRAVSIQGRYNPELRRHFMPVRFWKNLTELKPDEPGLRPG